ncbi:MAG: hypothetical protein IJU56_10080, partial [Clostridia bacterium]|nr:hypothetical protein [Clostridia bacterium]
PELYQPISELNRSFSILTYHFSSVRDLGISSAAASELLFCKSTSYFKKISGSFSSLFNFQGSYAAPFGSPSETALPF